MEVYPYAWMFFIPFILSTTFTMLNLFIGIVVNAMQSEHDVAIEEELALKQKKVDAEKSAELAARIAAQESRDMLVEEIRQLRREIAELRQNVRAGLT
jgi:voltage-gated sodium channel